MTEKLYFEAEKPFFVTETIFFEAEKLFSEAEKLFFVTETIFFEAEKIFFVTKKMLSMPTPNSWPVCGKNGKAGLAGAAIKLACGLPANR